MRLNLKTKWTSIQNWTRSSSEFILLNKSYRSNISRGNKWVGVAHFGRWLRDRLFYSRWYCPAHPNKGSVNTYRMFPILDMWVGQNYFEWGISTVLKSNRLRSFVKKLWHKVMNSTELKHILNWKKGNSDINLLMWLNDRKNETEINNRTKQIYRSLICTMIWV